jgi:hypothetical protein
MTYSAASCRTIYACFAALLFAGCASYFEDKQGSGNPSTSSRAVAPFSRIELQGAPDLQVTVGSPVSVVVNTDDNLQPLIQTTVANDTLRIYAKQAYSSPYGCKVLVTVPSLSFLSICGSGDARVTGIAADTFTLRLAGSSVIELLGKVANADFCLSGSGSILAGKLIVQNLKLAIQGSGNAVVYATGPRDVQVTGSGRVTYASPPAPVPSGSGDVAPAHNP